MNDIWIRKYSPKKLSEVIGQNEQIDVLKLFVRNHKKGSKPIFLYGGTGNGKTTSVYALAEELGLELVELNASDNRKSSSVTELLSGVINQVSLFGTSKIVLIDEVDGVSGIKDRGAIPSILKIVPDSRYPVVLVAHDAYSEKLKALKKVSQLIEFKPLDHEDIYFLLKKICYAEKVSYDDEALKKLARISGGDARAAVNDLQTLSAGKTKITSELIDSVGERKTTKKIEDALSRVFKTTNPEVALGAFDDVDEDLDKIFLWVEENIPKEYLQPEHLKNAFNNLSLADVFYGRIRRWQYYRFYVYCYNLLSAGIALSKDKKYAGNVKYKQTSRLLKIWIYNNANAKKKGIAQKIAAKTHTSAKYAFENDVPFVQAMFSKDKALAERLSHDFDLNDEEIAWLKKHA